MNHDLSILHLILNASLVVQLVMLLLLVVSVSSWVAILRKLFWLKQVTTLNDKFEQEFWSGTSLNDLFAAAAQNAPAAGPMERIFASGMREYQKLLEKRISDASTINESVRSAMRASHYRAIVKLECNLSFLATVGSVSPYLGLFGAIWGFMHAFNGLDAVLQVTLGVVGPAIVESLTATAVGLLVSIPAVIAYNQFANDIYSITTSQEIFIEEFSNILLRNLSPQVIDASAS